MHAVEGADQSIAIVKNRSGNRANTSVQVPSGVIYSVALVSLFFFSATLLFLFPAFFHLPVILTTSRNHENKPKNPSNQKGGQGLVVLRVLPSPYGSGIFPLPRLKGRLFLT